MDRLPQIAEIAKRHLLLGLVMAAILYGSLYPFDLHLYDMGQAGLSHLLASWRDPPQGKSDVIANILLYMPLGFAAGASPGKFWRVALKAAGIGAGLSFLVEWLQFYDESRVSSLSDFYLNTIGSLAGALVLQTRARRLLVLSLPPSGEAAFARALLLVWLGWRLYPYVPAIDLHKYWNSLKPVVLDPEIRTYHVFQFAVLWLGVSRLLDVGVRSKMPLILLLAAMTGYFGAKVLIVNQALNPSEMAGAAIALILSRIPVTRYHPAGLALLFAGVVILSRILPWIVGASIKSFQWIPFFSLLHGSAANGLLILCEKTFLYGTLLLLLVEAGLPLSLACLGECIALLATSALQTLLAGRSAEATDAVLTLLLAIVYLMLERQARQGDAAKGGKWHAKAAGLPAD